MRTQRRPSGRTTEDEAERLVARLYAAFNARDFDTWESLLADDVDVHVDADHFVGRAAARGFAASLLLAYPGVGVVSRVVTTQSADTVVSEFSFGVLPDQRTEGDQSWRVDGRLCEVIRVRDGRIVSIRGTSQAVDDLRQAAREQSAFSHVAELIAHESTPDAVMQAIVEQTSQLLDGGPSMVVRHGIDAQVVVAATGFEAAPGDTIAGSDRTSAADGTTTRVPIVVSDRAWGEILATVPDHVSSPSTTEWLRHFADLAAAAVMNAESKAKLSASRARVVAAADRARRRLQRDVHDAAQQRLVHTIITLKLARDSAEHDPDRMAALVEEALRHAERANTELRDVLHGIMPAALAAGGLRAGIESLVSELDLQVDVRVSPARLPRALETTAYFVVAEALTNVIKHAHATSAEVSAHPSDSWLDIVVRDDGRGGADPALGTGITGLFDRVESAEGHLEIDSVEGSGTTVRARLPIRMAEEQDEQGALP